MSITDFTTVSPLSATQEFPPMDGFQIENPIVNKRRNNYALFLNETSYTFQQGSWQLRSTEAQSPTPWNGTSDAFQATNTNENGVSDDAINENSETFQGNSSGNSDNDCQWNPWVSTDYLTEAISQQQNNGFSMVHPLYPRQKFQPNGVIGSNWNNGRVSSVRGFKPVLHVFCVRPVNFCGLHVQFVIQVFNSPIDITLNSVMFDAIAETPSGALIPCQIKKSDSLYVESFSGTFKASDVPGYYQLKVRMVMPQNIWNPGSLRDRGIIMETIRVCVSRNYFRESSQQAGSFECDHVIVEDPTSGFISSTGSKVWGLACDMQTNNLYYSDRAGHKIVCLSPDGKIICNFGSDNLSRPTGIACDQYNRRLIVADKDNHRISQFTLDGEFISSFGSKGHMNGLFNYPWDVAVNTYGSNIVVADSRNKRIQMFDRFGNYISKYSVFENNPFEYKAKFDYPRSVCFDNDGTSLYVTDFNVQNVLQIPLDFSSSTKLVPDGKLRRPQGIVTDCIGTLLIADSRNNAIRHINSDGQLLSTTRCIASVPMEYPVNVAIMSNGYLAILDGNAKISIF